MTTSGRAVAEGGEQVAERMAGAAALCRLTSAGLPRRAGKTVGHRHHHRFLERRARSGIVREALEHRQLGRAGIAEDRRHSEVAEQSENGVPDVGHRRHDVRGIAGEEQAAVAHRLGDEGAQRRDRLFDRRAADRCRPRLRVRAASPARPRIARRASPRPLVERDLDVIAAARRASASRRARSRARDWRR